MEESCPDIFHQFKLTTRGFSIKETMGKQRHVKTKLGNVKTSELVIDTLFIAPRFELSVKCDIPGTMLPPDNHAKIKNAVFFEVMPTLVELPKFRRNQLPQSLGYRRKFFQTFACHLLSETSLRVCHHHIVTYIITSLESN